LFLPADAEVIARETRVPGLATVLDPEAFVAALVAQAGDALAGQVW